VIAGILVVLAAAPLSTPALTPTAATTATTTATTTADPCRGQLDAGPAQSGVVCAGPQRADAPVAADAATSTTAATPPQVRDPGIFPGELGFVAVVVGAASGAALAATYANDPTSLDDAGRALQDNTRIGAVVGFSLAGLIASAAVATWVFDPSTGALRLPIFEAEDHPTPSARRPQ
jgi:hypothetical protein